jgi:hypothetical protein
VFEITSDREEDDEYRLTPVTLHCAGGIGTKHLSDEIDDEKVIRELAHRIVASCILKAREANDSRPTSHLTLGSFSVPAEEKIIASGALIFENLDYPNEVMLELLGEACIATCPWDDDNLPSIFLDWLALPSSMRRRGTCTSIWRLDRSLPKVDDSADVQSHPSFSRSPVGLQTGDTARTRRGLEDGAQTTRPNRLPLQKLIRSLCTLVFAFSFVSNAPECRDMPLSLFSMPSANFIEYYRSPGIQLITIPTALKTLANMLLGPSYDAAKMDKASIISCWGWSIVLSAVNVSGEFRPPCLVTRLRYFKSLHPATRSAKIMYWTLSKLFYPE